MKSKSQLLGSIISGSKNEMYFCDNCHSHFKFEHMLESHHKMGCMEHTASLVRLPTKECDMIKFINIQK
jgi:hypothetical protein